MPSTGALSDITILDLTRVLCGPYCTMQLADIGANVIKIETPKGGDDTRAWGPSAMIPAYTSHRSIGTSAASP